MIVGVSTLPLIDHPIVEATQILIDFGFRAIEFFCDSSFFHPDHIREEEIKILLKLKEKLGLVYYFHAPIEGLNPSDHNPQIHRETFRLYYRSVEISESLSCSGLVIHPRMLPHPLASKKRCLQNSIQLIQSIQEIAEEKNVPLLIENTGFGKFTLFRHPIDFLNFLKFFTSKRVKGVMDIGHAKLQAFDLIEVANLLGGRLVHLHLNDNSGEGDEHLPLGTVEVSLELKNFFSS